MVMANEAGFTDADDDGQVDGTGTNADGTGTDVDGNNGLQRSWTR